MSKRSGCWVLAILLCGVLVWRLWPSPVKKIEIGAVSARLTTGVSARFPVKGYTADGSPATGDQMAELDLVWEGRSPSGAFALSEDGVVTPLAPGIGNVWVRTADGKLHSRPITVTVQDP